MSVAENQRLHLINYNFYLPHHRGSKRLFVMFDLFLDYRTLSSQNYYEK